MILRNVVAKAESMAGKINTRFSISCDQLAELSRHYTGRFEYGLAAFRLGYMQGMKAAKAEQEKRKRGAHYDL